MPRTLLTAFSLCSLRPLGFLAPRFFIPRLVVLSLLILIPSLPIFAFDEYRLEDGAGDVNFGVTGGSPSKASAWLNHFVAETGKEKITSINIAFGSIPVNTTATAYLWGDFNGDGNPSDAFVLGSFTAGISSPNFLSSTNAFQTFDIPDVEFLPGTSFFAGVIVNNYASSNTPMRYDDDGTDSIPTYLPNQQSWVASQTAASLASVDPNNLSGTQLPLVPVATAFGRDGTWLIRLNASAVPEPTSCFLLLVGTMVLALGRRSRSPSP